jgi:hypothetical protein
LEGLAGGGLRRISMAERFVGRRSAVAWRGDQVDGRFVASFVDRRQSAHDRPRAHGLWLRRAASAWRWGYRDLNDRDELRGDPVLVVLLGKLERAARASGLLAGKSTLNPRANAGAGKAPRYHKVGQDAAPIEKR